MSLTILTAAGLMASATAPTSAESSIIIVAQTELRSTGLATNILANSTPTAIDQTEPQKMILDNPVPEARGDNWHTSQQTVALEAVSNSVSEVRSPSLPTYLSSPTTAGSLITIGSTLEPMLTPTLISAVGQQNEAQPDENVIVVTAPDRDSPIDPLANINAEAFQLGQDFDRVLMEPVANAYKESLPKPARSGIRNFLNNLGEPIVFLNYLLQLKPGKALETLGRFAVNSTIGVAGLFDVAKKEPFNLPHRRNGFANTLGYYGVESGSYLYLPIVGATTVRDLIGDGLDLLVLPTTVGKPFNRVVYTAPAGVLRALDRRIELDDQIREIQEESADPYVAQREFYLETRQREIDILKGRIPDPLSRKNKETSKQQTSLEAKFKYETAELWYLPSAPTPDLTANNGGN